jgi:succinoglycan biosynthesis transport protein ExoP
MTIHHLLRILFARKWWIFGSILIVLGVAVIVLQLTPKRYVATASVVVNTRGSDPLMLTSSQSQNSSNALATQLEIIKRPRIARRVVADLGFEKDPKYKEAWVEAGSPGDYDAWLAQLAASGLSTVNGSDSNVIDLQYASADPQYAARMANAFAAAYLSTTLDLRTDPARQYVTFFDQRLAELRTRVEQAQGKLSSFEKESGIVNAGGKLDVENARLAEFSSQLATAKSQQADSSSRQHGTQGNASTSPEVMQNPLIQSLKGQLSSQEVKVHEMSLRLGPNHPVFRQAQGELNEIRARLNAEIGQVSSSVSKAQSVSSDRLAETQAAFDAQRQRVLSMQEQRDKADVLQKEVENAQRAYDLVMTRQTQTTLESQAQQTDATLLDKASTPASAAFPNVRLTLMAALVAGALLGIVLALGREFFSPLIRSSEDLLTYTGLPVLAVVPSARLARIPRMSLTGPRRVAGLLSN